MTPIRREVKSGLLRIILGSIAGLILSVRRFCSRRRTTGDPFGKGRITKRLPDGLREASAPTARLASMLQLRTE
jgi:hypothetical protein